MGHRSRTRTAVEAADMVDLVLALLEPNPFDIHPTATGSAFSCPSCQISSWIMHGPAAHQISDVAWRCSSCRAEGTRWGLERRVLESPAALDRFMALLGAAA